MRAAPFVMHLFKGARAPYFIIGGVAVLACVLFYFLGFLFIETISLVLYVSILPAILIWERRNRAKINFPMREDERWSKAKSELEKLEKSLKKPVDPIEKQKLLTRKLSLESELRRLEWQISETEMTEMYNASRGLRPLKADSNESSQGGEKRKRETKYLSQALKSAKEVLQKEPAASRDISLLRIANDLRAHYNVLNKEKKDSNSETEVKEKTIQKNSQNIISDYWASWAAIQTLSKGVCAQKNLAKYTSKEFLPEFSKFLKFADSQTDLKKDGDSYNEDFLNNSS